MLSKTIFRAVQITSLSSTERFFIVLCCMYLIQGVPLATEPGISLIILSIMRILQRNSKRTASLFKKCEDIITCAGSGKLQYFHWC